MAKMTPAREAALKAIRKDMDALVADSAKLKGELAKSIKALARSVKGGDLAAIEQDKLKMEQATRALEARIVDDPTKLHDRILALVDDAPGTKPSNVDLLNQYYFPTTQRNVNACQPTITLARQLELQAEKRLKQMNISAQQVELALTTFNANVPRAARRLAALKAELEKLEADAKKAQQWRDEIVLIETQGVARKLFNGEDADRKVLADMNKKFETMFLGSAWPAAQVEVWQAEYDDYRKSMAEVDEAIDKLRPRAKAILEMQIEALDSRKAAGLIEIDARHAAELASALAGKPADVVRKLETLAKKVKSRLSAKDMFERLRKARMVA